MTVCRRNVPVAEIRALPQPRRDMRPVGIDRGMEVPADFFEPLPERPDRHVASRRQWLRLEPLAFDDDCAAHGVLLPDHHRDPFDRGLVSQTILNGMTIVTPDALIASYPAPVLW